MIRLECVTEFDEAVKGLEEMVEDLKKPRKMSDW
jgi:hypothetical protein